MRTILVATALLTLVLPSCTRVIERPVPTATGPSVVTTPAISERVVERPSAATGASANAPRAACTWESQATSDGGMRCEEHSQFRCSNGTWERTALSC